MARFTQAGGSGSGAPGPQGPQGPAGENANTADFTFEESTMSTNEDMDISVLGVPGIITLSAYAGVKVQTSEEFGLTTNKIVTTSNGSTDNVKIGDDAYIGDGNIANHIVVVGQQDATQGGIVLGTNETESISTDATNLSLTANNDIVLNPGSTYAYIGTPQLDGSNRIAKMSDITGGGTDNHGDFYFDQTTLRVDSSADMLLEANEGDGSIAAQIKVGKGDVPINISAYDRQDNWFYTSDWSTAEWQSYGEGQGQIVITGMTNLENFLNNNFNGDFRTVTINGDYSYPFDSANWGGGNANIYVLEGPVGGSTITVETLTFRQSLRSGMKVDFDDSRLNIDAPNLDIYVEAGDDLYLTANQDDVHIRANDDIRFVANYNNNGTEYYWRMNSEGRFQLPGGGYIENPSNSSGDGSGLSTIKILPDDGAGDEQHIVIDPTQPNHIHIRAGGAQDYSNAELILGGERAGVHVSDSTGNVGIQSKKEDYAWSYENINPESSTTYIVSTEVAEPDYGDYFIDNGVKYIINNVVRDSQSNTTSYTAIANDGTQLVFYPGWNYMFKREQGQWYWSFSNQGYLNGPIEGDLLVNGIVKDNGGDLYVVAQEGGSVVLDGQGEYINSVQPQNQIATIGYVTTAVGVGGNGEVTRWSPNFTATGLTFTGSGATYPTYNSHYAKNGRMVSFWIEINLATVTNFGTGQYITALPFAPLTGTMNHFQAWANVDPALNPDIAGHIVLQADHLANTTALDLHYLKQAGGANSPLMEAMFGQDSPAELTTATKIYINGTYITAE